MLTGAGRLQAQRADHPVVILIMQIDAFLVRKKNPGRAQGPPGNPAEPERIGKTIFCKNLFFY